MTVLQNKLMNMALIILIAISLLGSISFVLYQYVMPDKATSAQAEEEKPEPLTADEMMERTIQTKEFKTNLKDNKYILVKFAFQLDSVEAKDELQKRQIQLDSIIISVLASTDSAQIEGEEGLKHLETALLNRVNEIMADGKVVRVYITDKILQ
jgi:flagellar FliL protein